MTIRRLFVGLACAGTPGGASIAPRHSSWESCARAQKGSNINPNLFTAPTSSQMGPIRWSQIDTRLNHRNCTRPEAQLLAPSAWGQTGQLLAVGSSVKSFRSHNLAISGADRTLALARTDLEPNREKSWIIPPMMLVRRGFINGNRLPQANPSR
jgi:hypothetical protein